MQHTLIIGSTVRCADDTASSVGGLIINPNRSHVDYVILNSGGPGGREYFVPSTQFKGDSVLTLPCTSAELDQFPHPERQSRQGTIQDNLSDLVVAGEQTPVRDAQGSQIGRLHGVIVNPAFEIQAILLDGAPDQALPISQVARHGDNAGEIVVHLARETTA